MSKGWHEVTKTDPCDVCGKGDWCAWNEDHTVLKCERTSDAPSGMILVKAKDGGGLFKYADTKLRSTPRKTRSTTPRIHPTLDAAIQSTAKYIGGQFVWERKYPGQHDAHVARFNLPGTDPETGKPKKEFRPYHHNGSGFVCADPPGKWPLYRVNEIPADGPIIVQEGELKTDEAWKINLPSVTSAHGCGSAHKSDWTPLAKRKVIILRDNDCGGQKYAEEVGAILTALGGEVRIVHLPGLPAKGDLVDWIHADGPMGDKSSEEIRTAILSLAQAAPDWTPPATAPDTTSAATYAPLAVLRSAADVVVRPLTWLWTNVFPAGKVSLLIGHPGQGKTLLALYLMAVLSRGHKWPDNSPCEAGNSIILSGEDDPEDTLVPRLKATGADLNRITIMDGVKMRDPETKEIRVTAVDLALHILAIKDAIERTKARLFVVDPVSSFVGKVDDHRNSELRGLLSALAGVARATGCAIVCVSHLRKAGGLAVHQAVGSLAYTAAARAVWAVLADPQNAERRLFLPVKMNLAKDVGGLAFHLVSENTGNGHPALSWETGNVTDTADEILNGDHRGRPPAQRNDAEEFLSIALSQGRRLAQEVIDEAEANLIDEKTLKRAKKTLGIVTSKDEYQGPYFWSLPKEATP